MIFLLAQVIGIAVSGDHVAVAKQDGVALDEKAVTTSVAQIAGVAFSRDGKLAVFGGKPAKSGEIEFNGWCAAEHKDLINAAAFAADWVATASQDKTIQIRSLDGKLLKTLTGHAAAVVCVAASPDGKVLVSGGADSTIRVWDPSTGELKRTIANHGDRVNAVAWSPDGKYLASGSRDRTMRVWQPEIGRLVRIVKHDAEVLDVAWPDAVVTVTASAVQVIESDSDKVLKEFDAGGRAVAATARTILVAGESVKTLSR